VMTSGMGVCVTEKSSELAAPNIVTYSANKR
jgi:hypothetical protein